MKIRDLIKEGDEFLDITESASGGSTSAGNVASVTNPMGKINRRPSLFGSIPYEQEQAESEETSKATKRTR